MKKCLFSLILAFSFIGLNVLAAPGEGGPGLPGPAAGPAAGADSDAEITFEQFCDQNDDKDLLVKLLRVAFRECPDVLNLGDCISTQGTMEEIVGSCFSVSEAGSFGMFEGSANPAIHDFLWSDKPGVMFSDNFPRTGHFFTVVKLGPNRFVVLQSFMDRSEGVTAEIAAETLKGFEVIPGEAFEHEMARLMEVLGPLVKFYSFAWWLGLKPAKETFRHVKLEAEDMARMRKIRAQFGLGRVLSFPELYDGFDEWSRILKPIAPLRFSCGFSLCRFRIFVCEGGFDESAFARQQIFARMLAKAVVERDEEEELGDSDAGSRSEELEALDARASRPLEEHDQEAAVVQRLWETVQTPVFREEILQLTAMLVFIAYLVPFI